MIRNNRLRSNFLLTIILSLIVITLLLTSCDTNATATVTMSLDQRYTEAAKTVIAEMTRLAPTGTYKTVSPTSIGKPTLEIKTKTATQTPLESPEPPATITPSQSSGVPPLPEYRVILDDDFSSGIGWYTNQEENFGFKYTENGYLIYVNILNASIWSIRETELTDLRIEIDAEQISGPEDGFYGASCRYQDEDNYYALVISENGQFGILKMVEGEKEFIQEGIAPDGVIKPGGLNNIIGDCIGDKLTLYANQTKLTEIRDETFPSGIFGLIVGTRRREGVEVEFRRVNVKAP